MIGCQYGFCSFEFYCMQICTCCNRCMSICCIFIDKYILIVQDKKFVIYFFYPFTFLDAFKEVYLLGQKRLQLLLDFYITNGQEYFV